MEPAAAPRHLFPVNITIEDARAAIAGCAEFKEKTEGEHIFIDYRWSSSRTFPDPATAPDARTAHLWAVKRECRGLVFSASTGRVVARRYHKFFNIGELPETAEEKVNLLEPHVILTKYDGSLVSPIRTRDGIRFATKGGMSDVSLIMEHRFLSDCKIPYPAFAEYCLAKDESPLFEWCSARTPIVLNYPKDILVLTAIRHNITGHYRPYREMLEEAKKFEIPCTEALETGTSRGMEELKAMKKLEGVEGFVIRFHDGRMYKVKTEWYFGHNKKDKSDVSFNSEGTVWKYAIDQQMDDAVARITDQRLADKAREFQAEFWKALTALVDRLTALLEKLKGEAGDKKSFVTLVGQLHLTQLETTALYQAFDGKDLQESLLAGLRRMTNTPKQLDQVRPLLGNLRFIE